MKNWAKIRLILIISALLAGSAFMAFAIFFNRATLSIDAPPPFNVNIIGLRSESCAQSPCSIVLAPGIYDIQITKEKYKTESLRVELIRNTVTEKNVNLTLLPQLTPLGAWQNNQSLNVAANLLGKYGKLSLSVPSTIWTLIDNKISPLTNLNYLEISHNGNYLIIDDGTFSQAVNLKTESTPVNLVQGLSYYFAPNQDIIYFLAEHPKTYLPSLYRKDLNSAQPAELLINFLRKVKRPVLFINQDQNHVALLENLDEKTSSLYLIDLVAKTRHLVDENNAIVDFLWLPDGSPRTVQRFLIEKVNPQTVQSEIYLSSTENPQEQKLLSFPNRISTIYPLNQNEILYAEPFVSVSDQPISRGFDLKKFNLETQISQTIFTIPDLELPQRIEYQSQNRTLLILVNATVYSLAPIL